MANVLQKQDHGMAFQRRRQHGTVLCIDFVFITNFVINFIETTEID